MQKCMVKCKKVEMQVSGLMCKCNCMNGFVHIIYGNTGPYGQIA